jgi:O-antigen/teichoic acid export membrane protein
VQNSSENFKKSNLGAQLIRGFAGNSGLKIVNMLLLLSSGILLARLLGPENFGLYSFIFTVIALLGLPAQAGVDNLIIREVARYHHAESWQFLRGILASVPVLVLAVAITIAIIAAIFVSIQSENELQKQSLYWALLLIPLVSFANIRSATLKGLRRVVLGNIPEQIVRPLVVVILLILAYYGGWSVSTELAIQYNVAGAFLAFVIGTVMISRVLPTEMSTVKAKYELDLWVKSYIPLSIFSALFITNKQINTFILGMIGTHEDVGFYRIAYTGAEVLSSAESLINAVFAPYVVQLYQDGNKKKLQKMMMAGARTVFVMVLPLSIAFIFWGDVVVENVFGHEYLSSVGALVVLTIGKLLGLMMGAAALVLVMVGHERETVKALAYALLLNVCLCFILIPNYGDTGAAIAASVSVVFWKVFLAYRTIALTGIRTTII